MIHARDDYNRIQDPAGKIPADEPVFLLRAQDQSAPMAVAYWAAMQVETGGDLNLARLAFEHAILMQQWPHKKQADL
jgi:hypothetical protein